MSIFDPIRAAIDTAEKASQAATDALLAANATLTAENASLRAQIQAQQPTGTRFGIDLSNLTGDKPLTEKQKVTAHRAAGLRLTNVRVFAGSSVPSWSDERVQALDPARGDSILVSTLSRDKAGLATWLRNTPDAWRGHVRLSHGHEREADILKSANPTASLADWLAGCQEKAELLDAASSYGYSSDDLVKIMLWYSQVIDPKTKGSQERFHGGQDFGMWGMDCYHNAAWLNVGDRYTTPAELFDPVITFARQAGRPVCVPEWGATLAKTDTHGTRRAQAITDGGAYLKAAGVVFANWWCGAGSLDPTQPKGYRDFHLDGTPALAAYVAL